MHSGFMDVYVLETEVEYENMNLIYTTVPLPTVKML